MVIDDDDEAPWETCPVCRRRPTSLRVSARALPQSLPRGWRPLGSQRPVGAWAADLPCCIECGTCWFVWHDARAGFLEATAPLPETAQPLLSPASAPREILPLLRLYARGEVPSWVQERIDDLLVAWFSSAPLRPATAAVGLLHAATVPERRAHERAAALRALTAVFRRARQTATRLEGDWLALLVDARLRTSGPAVIDAFHAALEAGLAPPPVLRCGPELAARLQALRERPAAGASASQELAARIRRAFRTR